jgi:enoyl-CoA hydratase/carnithine racemase
MRGLIRLAFEQDIAIITIARPEKRNGLSEEMWRLLAQAAAQAAAAGDAKVILIRGAGGHFASGADIEEFASVFANRARAASYFDAVAGGVGAIDSLEKPVIAMIEGACVGGGASLALACDLRLAADNIKVGITPARLGLLYSLADTRRLVRAIGFPAAKDMLFSGRLLGAQESLRVGLVDEVHAVAELEPAVRQKCAAIAAASQWSVRKTKAVMRLIADGATADTEVTRAWLLDAVEQADFIEGKAAFLGKRPPRFPFR